MDEVAVLVLNGSFEAAPLHQRPPRDHPPPQSARPRPSSPPPGRSASPSHTFPLPSVIRLAMLHPEAASWSGSRSTRRTSSGATATRASTASRRGDRLTVDHVVPRSRGGGTHDWTNVVAACLRCNLYKGNRTPTRRGMRARPGRPRTRSSSSPCTCCGTRTRHFVPRRRGGSTSRGPGRPRRRLTPYRSRVHCTACLRSGSSPTTRPGDQPRAIGRLARLIAADGAHTTLLGVTGIRQDVHGGARSSRASQRPTLVISPNKTLAAQLYGEFKAFFPQNAVEYFVSYYDYYQPEAYIPQSDTYIEKDALDQRRDRPHAPLAPRAASSSGGTW